MMMSSPPQCIVRELRHKLLLAVLEIMDSSHRRTVGGSLSYLSTLFSADRSTEFVHV